MFGKRDFPGLLLSAPSRHFRAFYNLSGSNQARVRLTRLPDDDVDRVMHPVREIAVEVARWAKEGFVSVGHTAIGVCSGITFAGVRFDLGDADGNRPLVVVTLQDTAEQGGGDLEYVTSKETAVRETQSVKVTHRAIVRAGECDSSSNERQDELWRPCAPAHVCWRGTLRQ
jgi:hypothetical protein